MPTLTDLQARRQALDVSRSFICEAPAGSGKTELLTQRLLTLLAKVQQPEEILAITFTRKAAGEMCDRVIEAMEKARRMPEPHSEHERLTWRLAHQVLERDQQMQWHLLETPGRLHIKTFDSLCASLANTLPLHSSFASPPQVTEDSEELYLLAARAFIATLEEPVSWSDSIAKVLTLLDNNTQKLERLLMAMLGRRESWLPLLGHGADNVAVIKILEDNLERVRQETVAQLQSAIPYQYHRELLELAGYAATNLRLTEPGSPIVKCLDMEPNFTELPGANEKGIQQWLGIAALLLTSGDNWRKALDRRMGFPKGENVHEREKFRVMKSRCTALIEKLSVEPDLRDLLLDVRNLPSAKYDTDQKSLLGALIEILPVLSAYLSITFREKNHVDFSEVSIKARMALGKLSSASELAMVLDYRIQHILVDEFQDTSPAQIELLKQLTGGWEPNDGRTLFCVGDAMQSIYGFRNANVGLFLQCTEYGLGDIPLTPLRLSSNFRSQAGIVSWINTVFTPAFPKHDDIAVGAVCYSPSVPFQEKLTDRAVGVHGFADGTSSYDEARTILDIVRKTHTDEPQASIAILVRNRNHAAHIMPLLEEANLKYHAIDIEPLADHIVIQDLMALTHALLRPADRIAWLAVLRAPWCGLNLIDLEAIANFRMEENKPLTLFQQAFFLSQLQNHHHSATLSSTEQSPESLKKSQADLFITREVSDGNRCYRLLTEDGRVRLARIVPVLQLAVTQTHRKSLRHRVEGVWISLGGPACLGNQRDQKNARLFFSLLESLDDTTVLQKRDVLEKAVQKLFAAPAPDSDEKLQIMTIHKAKGLEFDTVIVPSLERSPRRQDPELLRWYERLTEDGKQHLLMSPITSSGREKDSVYAHLARQDKKREANEVCRLLYVACTRARKRLHLLAQVKSDKKDTLHLKSPAKSSLLYTVWPSLQTRIKVYSKSEDQSDNAVVKDKRKYLHRLTSQWQLPDLFKGQLLEKYIPYFDHDNTARPITGWQDPSPRYIGTLVHRVLQELDKNQLELWRRFGIDKYLPRWESQLMHLGIPKHLLRQALDKVQATICRVIENKEIHWLFSDTHIFRKAEYPVSISTSHGVSHLVIDLLLDDGAHTWVIDYKTSCPEENESENNFISREMSTYEKTMMQYQYAITKMGFREVKSALYFPMLDKWSPYDS